MAKEKTIILVVLTSLVVGFLIGVFLWSGDKPTTPPQVENFNPADISGTSEQIIEEQQPGFEAASGENPSLEEDQSTPQPNSSASQVSPPAPSSR